MGPLLSQIMSCKPLKILQYNVRKERAKVMIPLLESKEVQDMDILAIQELWYNPRNQSTYDPSTSQFHLFHRGEEGTRVCLYINKRVDIDSWEADYSSSDCCSIRLSIGKTTGEGPEATDLWIHNIYNPSPATPRTEEGPSTLPEIV